MSLSLANFDLIFRLGEPGFLLALLLAAHALADFVFQTARMAERKAHELGPLTSHTLQVGALTALFLVPFWSWTALIAVLAITLSHGVIDRLTARLRVSADLGPARFAFDQGLHLAVLLLAAAGLGAWPGNRPFLAAAEPILPVLAVGSVLVAAYAFNWNGGSALVSLVLAKYDLPESLGRADGSAPADADKRLRMGRTIGILERMLLLTLVLGNHWGALGLVLAAKSIARFKDLDQRPFSEYYLIGTLTSLLTAVASGLVVKLLI